jgi:Tfp pilus assembly protein PilX
MSFRKFKISSNESGFAVVLALLILLITTIAGMSFLFLAQKDKSAAVDSSTIRNVALAADAALTTCENWFTKKPDDALTVLNCKRSLDQHFN